ncbi:hypothetical protein B0H11DRAFT_1826347 [Mycena galericulata]|nr:hypothetical protein B0H11DRAFT_1826347 [Mycena galericulata]
MPWSESDPVLPAELERHIFEMASFLHAGSMPALLLVARRVKIWIEPLLYQVLSIYSTSTLYDAIDSMPAALFHENVRHVQLIGTHSADSVMRIMTTCDATLNLNLSATHIFGNAGNADILSVLGKLPLKRLSLSLEQLFPSPAWTDFTHSLFADITHLEIKDLAVENWDSWAGLTLIPRLTHLCFHEDFFKFEAVHVYRGALDHCESLEVLAIVSYSRPLLRANAHTRAECSVDPRFVMIVVPEVMKDWVKGARGGEDFWAVADKVVSERHSIDDQSHPMGVRVWTAEII